MLLGLLVASIAIAERPLNWEAAALLTLLLMFGLALVGIVQALIGTRVPTAPGKQRRLDSGPPEEGGPDLGDRQADALKQWEADSERLR